MKNFGSELKRGTLELILLQLLARRPAYGYELVRQLASDGRPSIKEGTVYPVLYRLEDRGWIEPQWWSPGQEPGPRSNRAPSPETGPAPRRGVPRKYYVLTDSGRVHLDALRDEWRAFTDWVDGLLTRQEEHEDE